ncbi:hypothetical protein STSO111631_15455 [Stackebrandtia soli]
MTFARLSDNLDDRRDTTNAGGGAPDGSLFASYGADSANRPTHLMERST